MQEMLANLYGHLYEMWRYRWSGLLIAWVLAIAGWFGVYMLPNQYQAKAVVFVDTDSIMKPLLKGLAVETDSRGELEFITRMLLSRENLLAVMRETDMDLRVDSPEARDRMAVQLSRAITLKSVGASRRGAPANIYEISYRSDSADRVYEVVSALLNRLLESALGSGRSDTQMAQKFLDEQIKEYESRLTIAEQALADFKKKNIGLMPDEKGGYYMRLQRLAGDIEKTRSDLMLAERRYAELKRQLKGETPLLGVGDYTESTAARLRQYQENLAEMLLQYTDQHPDVLALRAKIDDLKNNKLAETDGPDTNVPGDSTELNPVYQGIKVEISKAQVEVETLKSQLAEQNRKLEQLKKSVDAIPQVEAELARLNRDYEVTHARYMSLVDRRESARLAEKSGSNISFRVIEPPVTPVAPVGPDRVLLLLGVLAGSLGAGAGWTFLRSLFSPTFINFRQARENLGLPVLGAVSLHLTPEHRALRRRQLVWFLFAIGMLIASFGVALWFQEEGSVYLRWIILESGRRL